MGCESIKLTKSKKPCRLHFDAWRPHDFLAMACGRIGTASSVGCFLGFLARVYSIFNTQVHGNLHEVQKSSKVIKRTSKPFQIASSNVRCYWNALKYN